MLKKIYTQNAPEAIGPYSQAIQYDKLLFSSGQIPVDPENGAIVAGGIAAQAEQVMKNIGAILEKAGAEYASVLKTTCFLSDMNDFAAFNEVYAKYFTEKDFDEINHSNKLFVRKVNTEKSEKLLDMIDENILKKW